MILHLFPFDCLSCNDNNINNIDDHYVNNNNLSDGGDSNDYDYDYDDDDDDKNL